MYRILKATKDAYVTDKIIRAKGSSLTSSIDSNTGQAGTIDIFKLYNEPSGSGIQLSRGLIKFDLDPLKALTSSVLNINDPSFKTYVRLKNVYGGQTVPSNYTLSLFPLAKDWTEGRGLDVVGYRDIDSVNWSGGSPDLITHVIPYAPAEYEEAVVVVPSLLNQITVPFYHSFSSIPTVVITDISSSNNTIVNAFVDHATSITNLLISFSAPFVGSFVYRAAYDPTPGTPKTVVRAPRYPNQYANVELQSIYVSSSNRFTASFSDFGGTPTSAYATLYEDFNNNLADVYVTVTGSTPTSIGGAFSTTISAQLNVMGFRGADTYQALNTWTSGGMNYGGLVGTPNVDYYTSILLSTGYVPLEFTQSFFRGDEDLNIDVTPAIKLMLSGELPDNGFRLSFTGSQETDNVTRFVKRFSTRQSRNTNLHPALVVKYNDSFLDNQAETFFDYPNKVGVYNSPFSVPTNFVSGSTEISGSGSLLLTLLASASQYVTATTYSLSHGATISYQSASWAYFSASFTGSQIQLNGMNQTGSYYADVYVPSNAPGLSGVLQGKNSIYFTSVWSSLDGTVEYIKGDDFQMKLIQGSNSNVNQKNYVINITNLKDVYINTDIARMRVFVFDFDPTLTSFYLPYKAKPKIFKTMLWRLIDPYTKEELIPFDDVGTKLSADGEGMYFDLYMNDLPLNRPLEIELLIKEGNSGLFIENQRFMFKVVNQ